MDEGMELKNVNDFVVYTDLVYGEMSSSFLFFFFFLVFCLIFIPFKLVTCFKNKQKYGLWFRYNFHSIVKKTATLGDLVIIFLVAQYTFEKISEKIYTNLIKIKE